MSSIRVIYCSMCEELFHNHMCTILVAMQYYHSVSYALIEQLHVLAVDDRSPWNVECRKLLDLLISISFSGISRGRISVSFDDSTLKFWKSNITFSKMVLCFLSMTYIVFLSRHLTIHCIEKIYWWDSRWYIILPWISLLLTIHGTVKIEYIIHSLISVFEFEKSL